jgi:hypothetical protein
MSGVAHSLSESNDLPDKLEDVEPPVGLCALCGESGYVFRGAIEKPTEDGYTYDVGWRCLETVECRERRHNLKETPDGI